MKTKVKEMTVENQKVTVALPYIDEISEDQFNKICDMAASYAIYHKVAGSIRKGTEARREFDLIDLLTSGGKAYTKADLEQATAIVEKASEEDLAKVIALAYSKGVAKQNTDVEVVAAFLKWKRLNPMDGLL